MWYNEVQAIRSIKMSSFQQMICVGNVGRDPVFKYTPSGVPVCDFSVAVTRKFGGADGGEKQEKTLWVKVTCWRKLAEIANQYVRKGGQIMVVGTVEVRAYMDKNNTPQASLELTADNFQMLGSRQADSTPPASSSGDSFDQSFPENLGDIPF
jgi:single-strand DNA-binding protein